MPNEPLAYHDGRFLPQSRVGVPLHDAGFVMGATVTDLCRTFRHVPYRLPDHLARFRASRAGVLIPLPAGDEQLTEIALELVEHNGRLIAPEGDLGIVFLATPGPVGMYAGLPGAAGDGPPTLIVHTFPLPFARFRPLFERGAWLRVPGVAALPAVCVDPRVKQRSRMHWWLADQQARREEPGATALLCDFEGFVTETSSSNFLLVHDGEVIAAPEGRVLGGVSQQAVRELCGRLGIGFREFRCHRLDALDAQEALLTCTSYGLAGVSRVDGEAIPWPGPVLTRLLAAWGEEVGVDIARQILDTGLDIHTPSQ